MVANGCQTVSSIPRIPGIEGFGGDTIHSISYRIPQTFAGKRVLVLGASFSGIDIALQVSEHASKVYLSSRHDKINSSFPENIEQVSGLVRALGNDSKSLVLQNGSIVEADTIIFCTGYEYSMPFLDASSNLTVHKKFIAPLYKYVLNSYHPSMALIGIPKNVIAFPSFYLEAKYFTHVLKGSVALPDRETLVREGALKTPKNPYSEVQDDNQFVFIDDLSITLGIPPLPRYYLDGSKKWRMVMTTDLQNFRDYNMIVLNDTNVEVIHSSRMLARNLSV